MKKTNIHKLVFAAVLVALAVVGSLVSFPIGASKCAPVQHLVNIIGTVLAIVIVTALKKAKVFDNFLGFSKEVRA